MGGEGQVIDQVWEKVDNPTQLTPQPDQNEATNTLPPTETPLPLEEQTPTSEADVPANAETPLPLESVPETQEPPTPLESAPEGQQ